MARRIDLIVVPVCAGLLLLWSGRTAAVGLDGGALSPCPVSPNCVSSRSGDSSHYVEPYPYDGLQAEARRRLIIAVESISRSLVVAATEDYIHAEFTSAVFGFVDDAEFLFDDSRKVIHVRSASRSGYYDFGVNRRRIETIRALFLAQKSSSTSEQNQRAIPHAVAQ